MIDKDEIDGIVFQIEKGYCDNLFYQDPDSYFAANYTLFAMRNAGKKYVKEILLKSATTRLYDTEAKIICIVSKKGAQCIECHHKDI